MHVISKRLDQFEARVADLERNTATLATDQDAIRRRLVEHDEWMRSFDTKLESAHVAVDSLRLEVRATSWRRLAGFGLVLACVFILSLLLH